MAGSTAGRSRFEHLTADRYSLSSARSGIGESDLLSPAGAGSARRVERCRNRSRAVVVHIEGPLHSVDELAAIEPLWTSLHAHHLAVASYPWLVGDTAASWERRRTWYTRLLGDGGALFIARDDNGTAVGYAVTETVRGTDDTFDVVGGIVELVSLAVAENARQQGVGARLMEAVEGHADDQGVDTLKVAVMAGNERARHFYEMLGFEAGEEVLYRNLGATVHRAP